MNLTNWTRFVCRTASYLGVALLLPTQSILAQTNLDDSLTWTNFLNSWLEQEDPGRNRNGGGRLPDFCAVTSYADPIQVWHLQPIYLWQGAERPVAIRPDGDTDNTLAADVTVESATELNVAQSSENPLQPGESYDWILYDRLDPEQEIMVEPFQVMTIAKRHQVTTALEQLVEDLDNQGASAEEIALAKANYFLEQGLMVDAVQSMFLVEEPSSDLLASRTAMVDTLCNPEALDEE
ncbi:MAG: hypothetical protein AAFW84_06370 [Cyanobacteria bacterium J06635_15]